MSGQVVVFVGPTLARGEVESRLNCVVLPPVAQGDVLRAGRHRPRAIGIIDGYFERVPAVWHKEILWAMSQGVHVFGAASMGALRATELGAFGMRGVGRVFEDFRDGVLDRDDEVTVSHAGAEHDYRPLSVAMVNIRATLSSAVAAGVIESAVCDALIDIGVRTFYPERLWEFLLRAADEERVSRDQLVALRGWLPGHHVDQKADDARALLDQMASFVAADPPPMTVRWRVAETVMWSAARNRAGGEILDDADPRSTLHEMTLEELRLQGPARFQDVLRSSLLRQFALAHAEREGHDLDDAAREQALDDWRVQHGLQQVERLQKFLDANDVSLAELREVVLTDAKVTWSSTVSEPSALSGFLDYLRLAGEYGPLADRARRKALLLATTGFRLRPVPPDNELVRWYFSDVRREAIPADLAAWAYAAGFADEFSFVRALRREQAFRELEDDREPDTVADVNVDVTVRSR